MEYERPAIERRVPVNPPVIEGVQLGSPPLAPSPIWEKQASDGAAPGASPQE